MNTPATDLAKPTRADTGVIRNWLLPRTRFTRDMGSECLSCGDGRAELLVPFRDDLTQHHGYLHGGVVAAMIDNVASWAAASAVGDVVTADLHTNFLAPGRGERFLAVGEVVKVTRRTVVARADVFAETEGKRTLIATGLVTLLPTTAPVV